MSYAVDTNILARSVQENHPMHKAAKEAAFNGHDFKGFQDIITVIEPGDIVQPPSVSA